MIDGLMMLAVLGQNDNADVIDDGDADAHARTNFPPHPDPPPQNPAYFEIEDTEPSRMAPITGLAVEIWTVDGVSVNVLSAEDASLEDAGLRFETWFDSTFLLPLEAVGRGCKSREGLFWLLFLDDRSWPGCMCWCPFARAPVLERLVFLLGFSAHSRCASFYRAMAMTSVDVTTPPAMMTSIATKETPESRRVAFASILGKITATRWRSSMHP